MRFAGRLPRPTNWDPVLLQRDVQHRYLFPRGLSGAIRVTLHDRTVITGVAGNVELLVGCKGHRRWFALRDLVMICPAYQLFQPADES
jgi:hypothetical protein